MNWTWIDEELPIDNKDCLFYTREGFKIGSQRTDEDDIISYEDYRLEEIPDIIAWIYIKDIDLPRKQVIASDAATEALYREWVKRNKK